MSKAKNLNSIIALVLLVSLASIVLVFALANLLGVSVPIHIGNWKP